MFFHEVVSGVEMKKSDYTVKVIEKMFCILNVIENEKKPLGVNEIARKSETNVTSTFRILRTLMDYNWIYQCSDGRYTLGYKFSAAYTMSNFYFLLKDVSYPIMRRISDEEGEVVNLGIRQNDKAILLQQARTQKYAEYVIQVDTIVPLYSTAFGKILLSEVQEDVCDKIIHSLDYKPYTEKTIISPKLFKAELLKVRIQGYATDISESLMNTSCIGVSVRDSEGTIIAALSFSGLTEKLTVEREKHFAEILHSAASEITQCMSRVAPTWTAKTP